MGKKFQLFTISVRFSRLSTPTSRLRRRRPDDCEDHGLVKPSFFYKNSLTLTYKCRTQNYDSQAKIWPCERSRILYLACHVSRNHAPANVTAVLSISSKQQEG